MADLRRMLATGGLAVGLGVGLLSGGVLAQDDATPTGDDTTPTEAAAGHPAHIHAGTCADLGEVVQPLTNVSQVQGAMMTGPTDDDTGETGDDVGMSGPIPVGTSFTSVPLTLDAILGAEHSINVHLSDDEIGTYIACGQIGGEVRADGAVAIGLMELNDSGYSGIAYLSPGADGASTDVSVFLAPGLQGDDTDLDDMSGADDTGVDVDATVTVTGEDDADDATDVDETPESST